MSTDSSGGDAPKPRSFADAAALLPSLVPFPGANPAAPPTMDTDAAEHGASAAASPPSITAVTFGTLPAPASRPALPGRRIWLLALVPVAAAGLFGAWYRGRRAPGLAAMPASEQASAPAAAGSASDERPEPGSAGSQEPAAPEATPGTAAQPGASPTPVSYNMIVLHPRPASAKSNASNARIVALLQPLTARLETQKNADAQGRLTVHYFHAEDAAAAQALADTVRTPGAPVKILGPVHTQKAWPGSSFEVWLRGP